MTTHWKKVAAGTRSAAALRWVLCVCALAREAAKQIGENARDQFGDDRKNFLQESIK